MVYSTEWRIVIVKLYYGNNNNSDIIARIFDENHVKLQINRQFVMSVIEKLEETWSINHIWNEGAEVDVLSHLSITENH